MASTRSKNNEGDYRLEQNANSGLCNYLTCNKSNFGNPTTTHFAEMDYYQDESRQ